MAQDGDKIEVQLGANVAQLESGMEAGASAVDAGTQRMIELLEKLVAASTASTEEIVANEQKLAAAIEESSEESASSMARMTERIRESTAEAKESLEGFANGIKGIQGAFALLAEVAMLGFVGEKIADLGKEFAEFGEQTEIASKKSGLSTSAIQELDFAAKMTGVSAEGMNQAMMRLSRSMANAQQGSAQAEQAFKSVGLSAEQLKDMSIDQVLAKVADAFSTTEDGATKSAIAMQLFGRAGTEMIPLLDKGSAGIEELRKKAQELGIVMGGDDIEAAVKLNEQFKEMDAQMAAVKLRAGSELAPALASIAEAFAATAEKGGVLDTLFVGLGIAMKALVTVGVELMATFDVVAEVIATAAVTASAVAHGDFKLAAAEIEVGLDKIEGAADRAQEALDKLWASEEKGSQIDIGESGGGEDGWGEKGQLKLGSTKKSSGAGKTQLWKEELQEQEEASGQFFKNNLADEDTFWTEKLASLQKGSKDYLAVYHELFAVKKQEAQQDLADSVAATKTEYDEARQGSLERVNLANDIAQKIGQAYGFESREYQSALQQERKAAQEWAKDQTKQLDDQIVQQQKAALDEIAVKEQADKNKLARGEESAAQEIAQLLNLENQKFAIEMKAFDDELALYADDEQQYRKTLDAKLAATQKHALEVSKLQEQSADATQKAWQKAFSPISAAFTTSVNGMIQGTTTWQSAIAKMADSVLAKFIDMGVQMVTRWAANEAARVAATQAGSAVLQALGLEDMIAARTTTTTEVVGDIAAQAAAAAAGAYAATAAIPIVGPGLAPAAATEAYANVMAFEGLASAAGGYYQVPDDMLANIHKDEMVLPAWAAQGMRGILQGNPPSAAAPGSASSGSAGDIHVHINAVDSDSVRRLFVNNSDAVHAAVKQALRNNQR
ncbi:hypothetical protein [Trinickia mobilis]|uniref:hypothetical protein n=1 Tax=Trinickia mobilis TaxID=2816356 RepID=UPI001A8DC55C|nr:hypothetical protein [Trinickia mobilis]